ncbi:MAG: Gene SCO4494, often clustered with other genes in menaquinone via futalosine pathway [uncultured Sulfurovum sp.]|uniref:Aminodeoxyfutalosine synthase n=1 Tax=uncultured Sulfurovum sp. TaxID=269237 RepID=A0A6S6TWQ9_9BACT|nr:MAG: Gene SCO4494, often clustered with other genes in menaquinone via futalosine pathway [uncultured Sulfurovum sp.]
MAKNIVWVEKMTLVEKVQKRIRLTQEEGEALYELDLFTLGELADEIRQEKFGKKSYFNINRHINPTNVCADVCKFCAYSATRKNPNQYTMSHKQILEIVDNSVSLDAKEVHIVSAHNPNDGVEWYMGAFRKIKAKYPNLHIKAMTAAEVDFLTREYGISYDEVLDLMIENGVDSMPGGGAEIFDEKVREYLCKGKVTSAQWLDIHEKWHNKGRQSNATMLFGHVENRSHRIDHMIRLRDVQDRTNGFNAFIPLVYQRENNYMKNCDFPSGQEILKTYAIARIMLDNIPHIKAYWVTASVNLALIAQEFGCDDLDGTIEKESIQAAAGAKSSKGMQLDEFIELIKSAGFTPVERDSLYNELVVHKK